MYVRTPFIWVPNTKTECDHFVGYLLIWWNEFLVYIYSLRILLFNSSCIWEKRKIIYGKIKNKHYNIWTKISPKKKTWVMYYGQCFYGVKFSGISINFTINLHLIYMICFTTFVYFVQNYTISEDNFKIINVLCHMVTILLSFWCCQRFDWIMVMCVNIFYINPQKPNFVRYLIIAIIQGW